MLPWANEFWRPLNSEHADVEPKFIGVSRQSVCYAGHKHEVCAFSEEVGVSTKLVLPISSKSAKSKFNIFSSFFWEQNRPLNGVTRSL